MSDRKVFLKVKLKSLAAEARVIKAEESRRKVRRCRAIANALPDPDEQVKAGIRVMRAADAHHRARRRAQPWYPLSAQELAKLHRHRIDVVRVEARLSGIAYAIIRDRVIVQTDSLVGLTRSHWERVQVMLKKYGDPDDAATQELLALRPEAFARVLGAPMKLGQVAA